MSLTKLNQVYDVSNPKRNLIYIRIGKFDKYGRMLATIFENDITTNDYDHSINCQIMNMPGCHPYNGGTKTWANDYK